VRPDVLIVDYDLARATTGFRIAGASRVAHSRRP